MSGGRVSLPVRRWLALAVILIFAVPAATFAVVGGVQYRNQMQAGDFAAGVIAAHPSRWNDPAWRAHARAIIDGSGASFALMRDGRRIYSSRPNVFGAGNQLQVREVASAGAPRGEVAYLYTSGAPWSGGSGTFWLFPLAGLSALLVTLGLLAWFFGRTLVRPLTATGRAARQIAAGELDIQIPDSRIREVADLKSAFANMSSELGKSLRHQAELEEERRLFVGAIAHDLRTPLFSLRGYLEGLEQGVASTPAKRKEYIHVAREKADALENLIADLFAYARVEYLDQAIQHDPVSIRDSISDLVDGRRREAAERGVDVRVSIEAEAMMVRGDYRLLERALGNILDNALRYTKRGAGIRVQAREDSSLVVIIIADSGPGIQARDLPHVFEPMYRGDNQGGTGLGLAISRRIFQAHGGDLVASNGEDGGAVLTASLPVEGRRPTTGATVAAPSQADDA